jgi:polyferredoxin
MIRQGFRSRLARSLTRRGAAAWLLSAALFAFYILLYFTEALTPWARALGMDSKWTLYGALYTAAVLAGGAYVIGKYRHSRYQIVRTIAVMAVQSTLAFSVPILLRCLHQPEYYFSYFWPLKFEYLNPAFLFSLPAPYAVYSLLGSFVLVPLLALLFGKRWYCSWVCGCGGLANTAGDPFRHLSSKSSFSWKVERAVIYSVLAVCVLLTALLFVSWGARGRLPALERAAYQFQSLYGLLVMSVFSGVAGVGLYPLNGTRVWCRFGCPMAALLGILQKAGRYRIAVKEGMCISCGLCSSCCEMGIDVRSYAQAGLSFTRASCVGCGICADVCPRGVLRLENAPLAPARQPALVQIGLSPRG